MLSKKCLFICIEIYLFILIIRPPFCPVLDKVHSITSVTKTLLFHIFFTTILFYLMYLYVRLVSLTKHIISTTAAEISWYSVVLIHISTKRLGGLNGGYKNY